jgi:hypothetical protein
VWVLAAPRRLSFRIFFLILYETKLISLQTFTYIWRDLLKAINRRVSLMWAEILTQGHAFRGHSLYVVDVV